MEAAVVRHLGCANEIKKKLILADKIRIFVQKIKNLLALQHLIVVKNTLVVELTENREEKARK
ncbi:hypothetical protein IJI55_01135 [Candidatus Saccharibacteria bacterium]|nr:hypothetical protein [Candidatus Saccharibacteria bacterium]